MVEFAVDEANGGGNWTTELEKKQWGRERGEKRGERERARAREREREGIGREGGGRGGRGGNGNSNGQKEKRIWTWDQRGRRCHFNFILVNRLPCESWLLFFFLVLGISL